VRIIVMLFLGLAIYAVAPSALVTPALADTTGPARPVEGRTLTVTNRSDHTITELRVSRSRDDDWGDDRLGPAELIEPGSAVTLRLTGADCAYDVQAKYDNGRLEERRGVDVCRNQLLALNGSGTGAGPAAPPPERAAGNAALLNATPRTIVEVYVSPAAADQWGDNWLGSNQLPAGRAVTVRLAGGCRQDVRVVYDNRSAEERHNLDLCVHAEIRIRPGWTLAAELDAPPGPTSEDAAPRAPRGGDGGGNGDGGSGGGSGGEGDGGGEHIRYLVPAP
jgi:uncharacterized membrane protein YgcG